MAEYESAADKLEAMINLNEVDDTEPQEEETEDTVDDSGSSDEETDQVEEESEDVDVEDDTDETNDGEAQEYTDDDTEDEEEETEENTLVDDDKDAGTNSGSTDAEGSDGVDQKEEDAEVNYQTKYEELLGKQDELQKFYDVITGEFKADGKMVKGFKDPHKVVQTQQAYHGLEGKMKVFKDHKPFLRALTERGMVQDTTKFDLAMDLVDGNKDALIQQMKKLNIDPLDLDMDAASQERHVHTASPVELAIDDVLENATRSGVQDKMENVLSKEWDNDSVLKLLDRPQDSAILVEHMQSGIYDAVQERISENERTDINGSFRNRSNYDQYMIANKQLEDEYRAYQKSQDDTDRTNTADKKARVVQEEKMKIADEKANTQYKRKVAEKEKEASDARAKATSMSKPKKRRAKKKAVNPLTLQGDGFKDYFDSLLKM